MYCCRQKFVRRVSHCEFVLFYCHIFIRAFCSTCIIFTRLIFLCVSRLYKFFTVDWCLTVWTVSVHRFKTSWICRFPRISYNVCKCLFLSFIFVFSFANLLLVTESILDLTSEIENSSDATIAISELTFGRDGFNRAVKKASKHLKELLPSDWMETYPAPKDRREWFGQGTIKS